MCDEWGCWQNCASDQVDTAGMTPGTADTAVIPAGTAGTVDTAGTTAGTTGGEPFFCWKECDANGENCWDMYSYLDCNEDGTACE